VDNRLAEWRRLLRSSTTQARTALQRIVRGRITFTPHVDPDTGKIDGYDFAAPTRFDRLFTGLAVPAPAYFPAGDRRGLEDITAEDTLDAPFGRLLENRVKVLASPTGLETSGKFTSLENFRPHENRVH
jgi:hypothetical protein